VILRVCDRFRCLPSAAEAEDAGVLRLMEIEALTRPAVPEGGDY
jgi:hypothetical protein